MTSFGLRVLCECPAPEEADLIAELNQIYSDCGQMHNNTETLPQVYFDVRFNFYLMCDLIFVLMCDLIFELMCDLIFELMCDLIF